MPMRRLLLWIPLILVGTWAVAALIGPLLPLDPTGIDLEHILEGPSAASPLGRDDLGRPVLDRLILGARTSLLVACSVVALSVVVGTLIGCIAAYLGGLVDLLVVRLIDVFLAFPGILLAIALAGVLGPGLDNLVMALVTVGWVGYARLARAQVLSLKHRDHVLASLALGSGPLRVIALHLLPLISAPLIVEATFSLAGTLVAEAGLSFLGLGVQPPTPSWGSLIREGARYMLVAPHLVLAPGLAISLAVLAVNLLGDRLRDRMDVREIG